MWSISKGPSFGTGRDRNTHPANQLGTLGTGNYFIEVCLDESDDVWFVLHSGSRGVGNRTGMYFIELAQKDMGRHLQNLPDKDLAYFEEGSEHFDDYWFAVDWAQRYAATNRRLMMEAIVEAVHDTGFVPAFRDPRKKSSIATITMSRRSTTTGRKFSSRGRVRCGLGAATWASFPETWGRAPISSRGERKP